MDERSAVLAYLPHSVTAAPTDAAGTDRVEQVEGTLLFADVSGFTRLSERLARRGRVGAEEMVGALSAVFGPLVDVVHEHGGDVLKFSGDALFVVFRGDGHALRGAAAAVGLRRTLRRVGAVRTSAGSVRLSMSQGLHTGQFWLVHAGTGSFRDVVAVGPDVSATFALESAAGADEVLLGPRAARLLLAADPALVGRRADGQPLLRAAPRIPAAPPAPSPGWRDALTAYVPPALRGRLADAVAESEHRTVTAAFVPFTGCDRLLAEHGVAAVRTRLDTLVDAAAALAARHHVTVVCVDAGPDGGKLMLVAGAPDADEHDGATMLRFCLDLVAADPGLSLRAGVNRGPAYAGMVGTSHRFTYSSMGDPVNVAARLAGRARVGQVVAGEHVLARADGFSVQELAPLTLKGKRRAVQAGVVHAATGSRSQVGTVPFVGRATELARLTAALSQAQEGHGSLVEVVGSPGVGASRLLAELAARGPRRTLRLRCERQDVARAYAASEVLLRAALGVPPDATPAVAGEHLLGWLHRLAPRLLPLAPLLAAATGAQVPPTPEVDAILPEFRAPRMRDAVEELLVATTSDEPVLVLVDDAGLMDETSRELFRAALRGLAGRRWLVVSTRRPGQPTLAEEGSGVELALEPLAAADAAALARSASPAPVPQDELERIVRRCGGNPLFLVELVRAWAGTEVGVGVGGESLPDTVEAVLAARIDRLPPAARRLLRYAAVLGETVDVDLLVSALDGAEPGSPLHQAAAGARSRQVWQALDGMLLPTRAGARRFEHDLLRRVAYGALPFARRRQLHARVAAALEASGTADPGLLALHVAEAGDRERTWRYGVAAADAARARFAHAEAADLYQLAVGAALASRPPQAGRHPAGQVPAELVAAVAERFGDSAETAGRYAQAAQAYAVARRLAPPHEVPRLLGKQGRLSERTGRYPQALRWYARGLRAAADLPPVSARSARMDLLAGRAGVRLRQGRYAEVLATCRAVLREADALPAAAAGTDPAARLDRASVGTACFLLDAALTDLGREDEAAAWRERALPVFEELGDLGRQADVLNNLGIDAYYAGRLDQALAYYERSREARARAGDVVGAATADNNIAEVYSDLGRLAEAEAAFTEALAVWSRAGYPVGVALATSNLGRLRTRQGRPEEALALLADALAAFQALRADALAVDTEARLAEARLAAGDAAGALALCEDLLGRRAQAPGVATVTAELAAVRDRARQVLDAALAT